VTLSDLSPKEQRIVKALTPFVKEGATMPEVFEVLKDFGVGSVPRARIVGVLFGVKP